MRRKSLMDVPKDLFEKEPVKNGEIKISPKVRGEFPERSNDDDFSVEAKQRGDTIQNWTAATIFWIIIIPVVVYIMILILRPTFVKLQNDDSLDVTSSILWTMIISIIIWVLFWGFAKCRNC